MNGHVTAFVAAALVALGAGIVLAACRDLPAAAEERAHEEATLSVVPAMLGTLARPPAARRRAAAPSVPPSVLSRAAEARALDRAPACPPPPASPADPAQPGASAAPPTCVPEPQAAKVEIEWDGARGE